MNESQETVPENSAIAPEAAPSPWPLLTPVEARILGCLIEKAATTPEYYPLTLNALTNACNQKSNRDPLMALTDIDVQNGLDTLRFKHKLVGLVHTAGSRVEKFKHTLTQTIPVDEMDTAVLCEMLVRGPQTAGELRTRTARMHPFESVEQVQHTLDELVAHPGGPLVVKLPREPGRREARWAHLLCGMPDLTQPDESSAPPTARAGASDLREELRQMRLELDELKAEFAAFRSQFEG